MKVFSEQFQTRDSVKPLSAKENAIWNSAGCFFYLGCQWLTTVLVVVLSSNYENSGVLAIAMSVGLIFTCLATCNLRTYQVSDVNGTYRDGNYIAFRLLTISVGGLVSIAYCLVLYPDFILLMTCAVFLLFKADESFSDVIYGVYQKNMRMDYIGKSQLIRGFVSLASFTAGLMFSDSLLISVIAMACSCFLVTLFFDLPHRRLFSNDSPSLNRSVVAGLIKVSLPLAIAGTLSAGVTSVVRQYYGISAGTELLGIYAAIATPAVLVQAAVSYLYGPWITSLAQANISSNEAFLKLFWKILIMLLVAMLGLVVLMSVFGLKLLPALYQGIDDYVFIFPFVLIATASVGLLSYVYNALVIKRSFVMLVFINVVAFAVSICSVPITVGLFDMNGINVAIIAGTVLASAIGIVRISSMPGSS